MYYHTYRPQKISDIDNVQRRDLLLKLFSKPESIPHALLLIGPRGTGKTSTARIIAKVVNCEHNIYGTGKGVDVCDICSSCRSIQEGVAVDVHEMDAASNRGVDDVRALREAITFAPAFSRYKVYIIDEVHMLTKEAFNALLKTLEEPPRNTIFILATTERERIPETILSRTMQIVFERATHEEIMNGLHRIVKTEKLSVDKKTLDMIIEASQGSFRDATKLLELVIKATDQSPEVIERIIHQGGVAHVDELYELIDQKKTHEAISWIDTFSTEGGNAQWLTQSLALYVRNELIASTSGEKRAALARMSRVITGAYELQRNSPVADLPLMAAVVELTAS